MPMRVHFLGCPSRSPLHEIHTCMRTMTCSVDPMFVAFFGGKTIAVCGGTSQKNKLHVVLQHLIMFASLMPHSNGSLATISSGCIHPVSFIQHQAERSLKISLVGLKLRLVICVPKNRKKSNIPPWRIVKFSGPS